MTPADLPSVLAEFHREKLALRQRHAAVARQVTSYSFKNTYQYVIAREDMHVAWVESALTELGGVPAQAGEPALPAHGKKADFRPLVAEDARDAEGFVARWRGRIGDVTNARHRSLLQVILGETLEHKRFFDQILAGRDDVLGRRAAGAGTGDGVLPVRWIE